VQNKKGVDEDFVCHSFFTFGSHFHFVFVDIKWNACNGNKNFGIWSESVLFVDAWLVCEILPVKIYHTLRKLFQ